MHLNETAVALVLFDSRSEIDPFAGVSYWSSALDEARRAFPLVKFLVASRIDRGGPAVSKDRIDAVIERYGFDGFFETSAQRGDGVADLKEALQNAIKWDELPKVSTTELFKKTKDFLLRQKKRGGVLITKDDLLARFRRSKGRPKVTEAVFDTCLGRLEAVGLIRRLSFGDYVLLQPEMLDDYCAWIAFAAREQPDGLGFIKEDDAHQGNFAMDAGRKLEGKPEESTMLLATVQEAVGRNIANREETLEGVMIIFPSELNADLPNYPGGYSLAMGFSFEGPVSAIYATLAVTLVNSVAFKKKDLFKNAALFVGPHDQVCGFAIEYPDKTNDALGRLTVFFGNDTNDSTQLVFLRYVRRQLRKLAFEESVKDERIYHCGDDDYTIPQEVVEKRRGRDETTVMCPICGRHFLIDDLAEQSAQPDAALDVIDAQAAEESQRQGRLTILAERKRTSEFHVFLSYNSQDKDIVRKLADKLLNQGVLPCFDEIHITAGDRFARKLEEAIDTARSVAVVIGPHGLGRWQDREIEAALQRSIEERTGEGRSSVRLIPVLLPGVKDPSQNIPMFLRGLDYVDLRTKGPEDRDQIRKLVAAILGHGLR